MKKAIDSFNGLVTDWIRSNYLEFDFEIVEQRDNSRITSITDAKGKVLVYAIVLFEKIYSKELKLLHETICSGQLIGETIRSFDYGVKREVRLRFILKSQKLKNDTWINSSGIMSKLTVEHNNNAELYCTICEFFNPEITISENSQPPHSSDIEQLKLALQIANIEYDNITISST